VTAGAPGAALEEGVALAAALPDLEIVGADVVRLPRAQPGMLFGSGKIDELKARIEADEDRPCPDRRSGDAGAAAQPRKGMGLQASGPHRPDPRDLCRPRAHP
jgi:hypothetical protein